MSPMRRSLALLGLSALVSGVLGPPAFGQDQAGLWQIKATKAAKRAAKEQSDQDEPPAGTPRILRVGPGQEYEMPSDVQKIVRSGDTVMIGPGKYVDCVIWPKRVHDLTIEGDDATIADKNCGGKGLFIIRSDDVTIRGITFMNAKVPDENGAGIRAQGKNLTVYKSRFINNQNGILASPNADSTIVIRDSYFEGNGGCGKSCAHGIYIGKVKRLRVEHSVFVDQHVGHHIKSRAQRTEIVDNDIRDGADGDSSFLIDIPNGGDFIMTGNKLEKGAKTSNTGSAVTIGEEAEKHGENVTKEIRVENNSLVNDQTKQTNFIRNRTVTPAVLIGNKLQGPIRPLVGPGTVK